MKVLPQSDPPLTPCPGQPLDVAWPSNGWPTGAAPAELEPRLQELLDTAFPPPGSQPAEFGQSLATVVVHRGRLVAERYGPTTDASTALISWSMAKSFTHALIGILVGDGRLEHTAPANLAQWQDPTDDRARITIDHLLRMASGLRFNEDYVDDTSSHCIEMLFGGGAADMADYTASQPLVGPPDTIFNYSSGTTVLLCRILADLVGSGEAFEAWMNRELLGPLGIEAELTFDDAGTWVGSSFLHASARDFAKFGLLYCRDGIWQDQRLLPAGWVDYARTPRGVDDEGNRYGAHWWMWPHGTDVFHASGYETQRIIVDPGADLVLVRLGKTPVELAPNVDGWLEQIRRLFS